MKKFVTRIKRLIKYLIVSLKILYSSNKVINKKCNSSINKSWIEGAYKLQFLKYVRVRPLYRDNELFIFYKGSYLYKRCQGKNIRLSKYNMEDIMYCDMVRIDKWFALRSGDTIRVSSDLVKWDLVYVGKRGIKDSMIAIYKENEPVIIFIEYSTGFNKGKHRVIQYNFQKKYLRILKTFYSYNDYQLFGKKPYVRHIHVIAEDPFSGDIYLGTGDSDEESGIYISHDKGESFDLLVGGSQLYRTLSFIFTKKSIFWNTDTYKSQYIIKVNRIELTKSDNIKIEKYPLINGALWCTIITSLKDETPFIIMSSNNEGALYDNYSRLYGIIIKQDTPIIYELNKRCAISCYSQAFPLGADQNNNYYFLDTRYGIIEKRRLLYN